jgi:hypothetical protein
MNEFRDGLSMMSQSRVKTATDTPTFDERLTRWQRKRYHARVGRNIGLAAVIALAIGVGWLLIFPH